MGQVCYHIIVQTPIILILSFLFTKITEMTHYNPIYNNLSLSKLPIINENRIISHERLIKILYEGSM
jgi:hypothetical protein